jgi:predicted 2-oxoglutarate/Fe(II)-dependent dioxygenase YbiX
MGIAPVPDQDMLILPGFAHSHEVMGLREAFNAAITAHAADNTALHVREMSARTEVPAKGMMRILDDLRARLVATMRSRITNTTRESFAAPDIMPEWTVFSQMRAGDSMQLHADAERQTPAGWEENHTPWRTHVGLLYLNTAGSDFQGGDLLLPEIGQTISPRSGLFVSFPSGRRHQHQVTTIELGARLSFVVWFTRNTDRCEKGWPG